MTIIYDVLLKQYDNYLPTIGYVGEPKYICIFYDENKRKALKAMQEYVKKMGFVTPDKKYTVADVVLRERESTGAVINKILNMVRAAAGKRLVPAEENPYIKA